MLVWFLLFNDCTESLSHCWRNQHHSRGYLGSFMVTVRCAFAQLANDLLGASSWERKSRWSPRAGAFWIWISAAPLACGVWSQFRVPLAATLNLCQSDMTSIVVFILGSSKYVCHSPDLKATSSVLLILSEWRKVHLITCFLLWTFRCLDSLTGDGRTRRKA
jgi:hypothetical protein